MELKQLEVLEVIHWVLVLVLQTQVLEVLGVLQPRLLVLLEVLDISEELEVGRLLLQVQVTQVLEVEVIKEVLAEGQVDLLLQRIHYVRVVLVVLLMLLVLGVELQVQQKELPEVLVQLGL